MPDDFTDYVIDEPKRSKSGTLKYQPANTDWSLDRLGELKDFYQSTYKRPLPLANIGQGSVHNRLGYDHRSSADVSLNPTSTEGQSLIAELQRRNIPFLAFDRAIPGVATGPHIHVGRPSSHTSTKYNVGSQVKRTKQQTQQPADDFDSYVTADPDFDKYVVDQQQAPSQPATPARTLTTNDAAWHFGVSSVDEARKLPRKALEVLTAAVTEDDRKRAAGQQIGPPNLDYQNEMRRRAGLKPLVAGKGSSGIGELHRLDDPLAQAMVQADQDTGVGRLLQLDAPAMRARKQAEFDVRARREQQRINQQVLEQIGIPASTFDNLVGLKDYLTGNTEAKQVEAEIQAGYAEQSRLRELAGQFTDADRQELASAITAMRNEGPTRRGLSTGAQRVTSGLLYKIAALTDIAGGPSTPTFPNYLGDYLRRKAGAGELSVQEIESELPPPVRQQLTDFLTHTIGGLPEVIGATAAAGPVGGFAALGGLEAAGRKQPFSTIAKEAAKGAAIGAVFKGSALAETGGQTTGERAADIARSGAVVGLGTYGVEKAFGADDYEAARAAATNVLFHAGMRVPAEIGRFAQAAERALKTPEELAPPTIPPAGIDSQPPTTAVPAAEQPVAAEPAAPSLRDQLVKERRGPTRMPDADWLELTPAERAAVRREVDLEQQSIGQPAPEPLAAKPSLADLMRERSQAGPKPEPVTRSLDILEAAKVGDELLVNGRPATVTAEGAVYGSGTKRIEIKYDSGETESVNSNFVRQGTDLRWAPVATPIGEEPTSVVPRQPITKLDLERAYNAMEEQRQREIAAEPASDVTDLGEVDAGPINLLTSKPVKRGPKEGGGKGGFLDLTEIAAGLNELRAKFPDKSERDLRAMLPINQRALLDREQPLHPSTEQPRTPTGQFEPGEPGGPEAARSLLRTEARKYAQQYKAVDLHQARRNGLDVVNDDVAHNYFSQLRRIAAEHLPAQARAVDQAESLYNQGQYSKATMLAESVFGSLPDKVNEYSSAMAAMQLNERGIEAKTNWSKVLQEVRERWKRTGGVKPGGSTFYDVNKHPEGGRPDHAKIAYILEPVIDALKADARRLIAEGKLKAADYVDHIRSEVNKMLQGEEFADWHPLNKSAAMGVLVDRLRRDGPPVAQEAEPPQQRNRSLPPTLERSGRDPGTNLTYDRLPNATVNARVEARLAAEGADALETWYRNAPESADRTAAHRVLVDYYVAESVRLADTAPKRAEELYARSIELDNIEAERSTLMGQAQQMYSNLLKYSPAGVIREIGRLERAGEKVPVGARKELLESAQEHKLLDQQVKKLEKAVAVAEVEGGEAPQGATSPQRYRPRKGAPDSKAESARRKLDEATKRRRAIKVAIEARLRALEQSRTPLGYYKRVINMTRGLMVSALSTAMRNLQSQTVRFNIERLDDAIELTLRKAVGLNSDLTYRNIGRNTLRQFKTGWVDALRGKEGGQEAEAKEILANHPGELARMFNVFAGGVEVPIPDPVRSSVERVTGTIEEGIRIVNIFNRLQEFHLRSAEFLSELDLHLRKEKNQTLEQFVQRKGIDAIPLDIVRKGVDKALEVTFADMPGKDGAGGRFLTSMIEVGNYIPPTLSPVAFPRFMFNNLKFLYQHSPAGMLDLARRGQNAPRVISRALVGTSLLLLAYQFRKSDHAGEKWYELRFGNHTLDARPFGPFSTYLFMAEAIRRATNGERAFTPEEIAGAIGASTGPGGTAIAVAQKLYDYAAAGKWDKWQRILKTEAGEWGRALLTPVRQVKDLIAAFDASQAINRDTSLEPAIGPIKESIPYADTNLPPAYLPTTATPIHQEHPATKAITGWRVETPKTFLQRELDSLNFTSTEIRPSTGIPAVDQLEKRLMGPLMDQLSAELEKDAEYKKLPRAARAKYLRDFIVDIRDEVRDQGKAEHPELYDQLREERKPRRQREYEQEQNSPGLSKAIQLGVPMSIPPPQPGEDDIAYRARLLQVGKARRQRLDSAYDSSLPAHAQRSKLYSSLYV